MQLRKVFYYLIIMLRAFFFTLSWAYFAISFVFYAGYFYGLESAAGTDYDGYMFIAFALFLFFQGVHLLLRYLVKKLQHAAQAVPDV